MHIITITIFKIPGYPQQQPQLQQQQQMNGAVHDDLQPGLVNQSIQTPTIPQQLTLPADPNIISNMPPVQNKVVETVETAPQQPALTMDTDITYNEQNLPIESEPLKDDNQPEKIAREDSECDIILSLNDKNIFSINNTILASKTIQTEPTSYANLLKSEASSGMSFASAMSNSTALNIGNVRSNVNTSTYSTRTAQDARSDTNQSQPAPQRSMNSRPPARGMF